MQATAQSERVRETLLASGSTYLAQPRDPLYVLQAVLHAQYMLITFLLVRHAWRDKRAADFFGDGLP